MLVRLDHVRDSRKTVCESRIIGGCAKGDPLRPPDASDELFPR